MIHFLSRLPLLKTLIRKYRRRRAHQNWLEDIITFPYIIELNCPTFTSTQIDDPKEEPVNSIEIETT